MIRIRFSWKSMFLMFVLGASIAVAQTPVAVRDAAELQLALDKLQVLGSVLYIAAHPDDENTAALAYFSKGRKLRTAYLAMNRGGGGQNLIGSELDDTLAVIRTQELLAARRIDGAEQYFTRAVDFGFSKTTEETLSIWGHDAVLSDVVWTIRKFRPDVIVTRFTPTLGGHGHHTASAVLAMEAFKAAADPSSFPEQLKFVQPWQATRIYWNAWRTQEERDKMAPGSFLSVDIGQYDSLLGKSYAELGAEGRSQHRSQGFGVVAPRGSRMEYFERLEGKPARQDLFEDIDLTWHRVSGNEAVAGLLAQARQEFHPEKPSSILPLLLKALRAMDALPPDSWLKIKRAELIEAIRCSAGLWLEAIADRQAVAAGDPLNVMTTIIDREAFPVELEGISVNPVETRAKVLTLPVNQPVSENFVLSVPTSIGCTQPYWLAGPRVGGLHCAPPMELAGLPENPPALFVTFKLKAEGIPFELTVPVQFRFRDPVLGERYQPLSIVPPVMVNLSESVQVFGDTTPRDIHLTIIAGKTKAQGKVNIRVPDGWTAKPSEIPFSLSKPFDEQKVTARLTPPPKPQSGELNILAEIDGASQPARGWMQINYPHIPLQTIFPAATAKLVRLELKHNGRRIGYVMGAGDEIPQCLRPLGYDVDLLSDEQLTSADLSMYDAIVVGIRAFNTRPRLTQLNGRLLDYVAKGGTEVVQYNVNGAFPGTNAGLVLDAIGPYPFHIGRDRVTDETATMRPLNPSLSLLHWPNEITPVDFESWVQERGLYYADTWDAHYTTIFAAHDPGEKDLEGGLILAKYGKGVFIYTGLAFFRQLPDGVPGAYRLFANLLAAGKH